MPFWEEFCNVIGFGYEELRLNQRRYCENAEIEVRINDLADNIGHRAAVAITNSGQLLFLYRLNGECNEFSDYYSLHWNEPECLWKLNTADQTYLFQLPDSIMKLWLDNSTNELEMKKEAINCKANFLSNMIIYYTEYGRPIIKMISIDKNQLERAKEKL